MCSDATDVTEYIDQQPAEWQPSLRGLRDGRLAAPAGHREAMRYAMPAYLDGDEVTVGFAKQARCLSLHIAKASVLDAHRGRLTGLDVGKGCVRSRRPDQVDWSVVGDLRSATASSPEAPC
jgi:uncharacterized protein YdhG (YjbR/CyaY superfamily)